MAVRAAAGTGYLGLPSEITGAPYTLIAFFRTESVDGATSAFLIGNNGVTQADYLDTGYGDLVVGSQSNYAVGSGVVSENVWVSAALTRSGNTRTGYVPRARVSVVNSDAVAGGYDVLRALGFEFTGAEPARAIRALKAWNALLTVEEIAAEMQQFAPVRTANLAHYSPLAAHTSLGDLISSGTWTNNGATLSTVTDPPNVPEEWDGPRVASVATTAGTTSASGLSCNMPSGIEAGDLLLAQAANDTSVSWSASAGWELIDNGANGSAVQGATWARIATGSDALTITGEAQDIAVVVSRIVNHGVVDVTTDIITGTAATGSSNAPNGPNCNPGTSGKYLWIVHYAADDDDNTAVWWPAEGAPVAQIKSATGTSSCQCGVAYRWLEASSYDPSAFALAATEEWRAQTFAIPPASEGGEPVEIDCEPGAAVAAGVAASVSSPITIACNTGQAVAVGLSAGVASPVTIAGSVGQAVAAGLSASIASTTTIQASEGAAVASGLAANIASPITIACAIGQAEAAGLQASVSAGVVIDCSAGVAHAAGLQAGVSSPVTVSCETGAAVAAGLQAAVSSDAAILAQAGRAVAAGLPATVSSPQTIAAEVGQAVAAGLPVSITSGAIVLADVGRAVAAGLPATIETVVSLSGWQKPAGKARKYRRVILGDRLYEVLERDIPALIEAELLNRAPPVTAKVVKGPKPASKRRKAPQPVKTVAEVRQAVQEIKRRIEPDNAWLMQALESVAQRVLERLQDEEDSLMLLLAA